MEDDNMKTAWLDYTAVRDALDFPSVLQLSKRPESASTSIKWTPLLVMSNVSLTIKLDGQHAR